MGCHPDQASHSEPPFGSKQHELGLQEPTKQSISMIMPHTGLCMIVHKDGHCPQSLYTPLHDGFRSSGPVS